MRVWRLSITLRHHSTARFLCLSSGISTTQWRTRSGKSNSPTGDYCFRRASQVQGIFLATMKVSKAKKKKASAQDVVVEGKQFDAVLAQLLKMDPIPMKKIKTSGRKGSKAPMFRPKPSAS